MEPNIDPPDLSYVCEDSGETAEDCPLDHDGNDCPEDTGCNICGAYPGCHCDDLYEAGREREWDDDYLDDIGD